MATIKRLNMDLQQAKQLENAIAENEANKAKLDYLSMMVDVELPTDSEVDNGTLQEISKS